MPAMGIYITTREDKGVPLTHEEMDENFQQIITLNDMVSDLTDRLNALLERVVRLDNTPEQWNDLYGSAWGYYDSYSEQINIGGAIYSFDGTDILNSNGDTVYSCSEDRTTIYDLYGKVVATAVTIPNEG